MIRPIFVGTVQKQILDFYQFPMLAGICLGFFYLQIKIGQDIDLTLGRHVFLFILAATIGSTAVKSGPGSLARDDFLSLLFTRPIRRSDYVITKWCAIALVTFLIGLAELSGEVLYQWLTEHEIPDLNVLIMCADCALTAFGVAASVAFFFISLGRIASMTMTMLVYLAVNGEMVRFAAVIDSQLLPPWALFMTEVSHQLLTFIIPTMDIPSILYAPTHAPYIIINYLSSVTIFLCLAAYFMNRREFFYASD